MAFLQDAVGAVAAIEAAADLGVLTRLERGPINTAELARECDIGERGARALLSALAGIGLVEARSGDDRFTWAGGRIGLSATLLWSLQRPWAGLADAIRSDRPAVAADTPTGSEQAYPEIVAYLGALFADAAADAAERLHAPAAKILDVGAGAAPWSLAIAARDGSVHVTAVDLPDVTRVTRRAVADADRTAQFTFLAGDFFTVDWGAAAFDLALAANVLHLFPQAPNLRLLARLFGALRPGGRIAIVDALPDEGLAGPRSVVLYALGLLLRTTAGQVYPFSTYASWLREAGFERIERFDLRSAAPLSLITARRPG